MICTSPLLGYRPFEGTQIVFNVKKGYGDKPLTLRCGRCMSCRLHHAYEWAIRITHETMDSDDAIFTTITYDEENLPYGNTLVKQDMQKFFKRLRKKHKIRVFYCGEYGGETDRAHYHAIIFNYRPQDQEIIARKDGHDVYRADSLDKIWGLGHINYADVTFSSAAYVAGYTRDKITGKQAQKHYQYIDPDTGQVIDRTPPFSNCSLKPGIGEKWLMQYIDDVYEKDAVYFDGQTAKPPRYYDKLCEKHRPDLWLKTKRKRNKAIHEREIERKEDPDNYNHSERRLLVRDKIIKSKQKVRKEQ